MQELIDLILHQVRNLQNQEMSIEYDGDNWYVGVVNMCSNVCIAEGFAKYDAQDTELILALMAVSRKIQMELGE